MAQLVPAVAPLNAAVRFGPAESFSRRGGIPLADPQFRNLDKDQQTRLHARIQCTASHRDGSGHDLANLKFLRGSPLRPLMARHYAV